MGTWEHIRLEELPQHNSLGLVPCCSLFLESWSSSLFNVNFFYFFYFLGGSLMNVLNKC